MHPTRRALGALPRTVRAVLERGPVSASSSSPAGSTPAPTAEITSDADLRALLEAPGPRGAASESSKGSASPASQASQVHGWLRSVRAHKNVAFLEVDDGTGRVQGVLKGKGRAEGLSAGTSVRMTGALQSSRGAGQDVEFFASEVEVLGACDPEKKHLPLPYLRDHAHLRFRTAQTAATMRVRDGLMRDWHDWFEENEFVHIHTPLLTSSDCEGAGETFKLQNPVVHHHASSSQSRPDSDPASASSSVETFFPSPVNLTVSSQLHLEAPTHALARTYTLSPSFRAEPSLTSRHLSEFYMLEAEVAFVDSLDALLDVVEAGFRSVAHRLMWSDSQGANASASVGSGARVRHARMRADLEVIRDTTEQGDAETDFEARADRAPLAHLVNLAARPFARVTYTRAVEMCAQAHDEAGFAKRAQWGEGLGTEHEKWLARYFDGPVFVTHYPKALKPFYMLLSDGDASYVFDAGTSEGEGEGAGAGAGASAGTETVACFDLLFPGIGELVGGSLREHRHDRLVSRMREAGLDLEAYGWYLDLRRFGSVPHGGWGMGWDRWMCWVTGVGNVRDVVPFPRWRGNCRY